MYGLSRSILTVILFIRYIYMDQHKSWFKQNLARLIFFLAFANLLILDLFIIKNYLGKKDKQISQAAATSVPSSAVPVNSKNCSSGCLTAIKDATSSLKLTSEIPAIPATKNVVTQPETSKVQEFFIPLGSGSSTASDWTDVSGVRAEIDSTKYPNIQKILFEASVHVPDTNQIVEVRLYNETDKYVVGNSEFLYPSNTTQNFRIASIQLGQGAKIYTVQMKTQLQHNAVLDQARIHITTN